MLHGASVAAMTDHLKMQGKPIPAHYAPPAIWPGCGAWIDAFQELSTDRQLTQYGSGPIPSASIERHIQGWDEWNAALFKKCIRAMDVAYLDAMAPAKEGEEKAGLPQPPQVKKGATDGD